MATACDRADHSVEAMNVFFGENTRFSMYIEISESRGISMIPIGGEELPIWGERFLVHS